MVFWQKTKKLHIPHFYTFSMGYRQSSLLTYNSNWNQEKIGEKKSICLLCLAIEWSLPNGVASKWMINRFKQLSVVSLVSDTKLPHALCLTTDSREAKWALLWKQFGSLSGIEALVFTGICNATLPESPHQHTPIPNWAYCFPWS